jgi:chromosome segregation protein
MHLKTLEMVGFKSFADKTKLDYEAGMTAIVGPNGCGKSNVADALRWVLGEQSAKALRGSKMEDCIFNGTDSRKPLGMAEVSITFTDCEGVLNTEYNEMTVTRRVFRSGEGQYFLNKVPCRLKDIHRLFMDTGIGTTSYSMMEQGRIDAILSARPEDRRAIFEEASGIMKFKADKKEAIRKLEYTEANLLRLSDVIREVKRQIGSLQRQAGKARRYKSFQEELCQLDIYATRERMKAADKEMSELAARMESMTERRDSLIQEIRETEQTGSQRREHLMQLERDIGLALESSVAAKSKYDHTLEMIQLNGRRIDEYKTLSNRDEQEVGHTQSQLEKEQAGLETQVNEIESFGKKRDEAEIELRDATDKHENHCRGVNEQRERIQNLQDECVGLESLVSRLQNQKVELETHARSSVIKREKLAAEKSQLSRHVEGFANRVAQVQDELDALAKQLETTEGEWTQSEEDSRTTSERVEALREDTAGLESQCASVRARVEMLSKTANPTDGTGNEAASETFSGLGIDQELIIGKLSSMIEVEPAYARALEVSLRSWLDAAVVRNDDASLAIISTLSKAESNSGRLIPLDSVAVRDVPPPPGNRLVDHVSADDKIRKLLDRLIGGVLIVDTLDALPDPVLPGVSYVTQDGRMLHANGAAEFWLPESELSAPLTNRQRLADEESQLTDLISKQDATKQALADSTEARASAQARTSSVRDALDECRRALAQKQGEFGVVQREAEEAKSRIETVAWELDELNRELDSEDGEETNLETEISQTRDRRTEMNASLVECRKELQTMESLQSELQAGVTDKRVAFEGLNHKLEHLSSLHNSTKTRMDDLNLAIQGRIKGMQTYETTVENLTQEIQTAESQLGAIEGDVESHRGKAEGLQKNRGSFTAELQEAEQLLASKRTALEELREARSEAEMQLTECRIRRENQVERVTTDYNLSMEAFNESPDPEWPDGKRPDLDSMDTTVAELRTKLDAMGPVNLVAIDEHKELEERYAFLTTQEEDLVKSKQQLMDMIRKINRTTSEMFQKTFDQVNENFLTTFKKLFDGGTAKLVLVNEEDVLDCGIEIIARPPGKRLQNVSLLSGGERTLTAVALLFAIYMIKPSPFCLLDELDAALDETNIGRFVSMLKGFAQQSQFVIITHNRKTIAEAGILYGVTMPEKGVSKIVSMKFQEFDKTPPSRTSAPPSPEPAASA